MKQLPLDVMGTASPARSSFRRSCGRTIASNSNSPAMDSTYRQPRHASATHKIATTPAAISVNKARKGFPCG